MAATIVGLDIGSAAIRAVEVQGATKSPVVVRSAEVPVPDGAVRAGEVIEAGTVASAIRRLWSTGGFKTKDVVLGMSGSKVFSRDLAVPRAPIARIRESLPFQVQELLPVPVGEAILDFYPISEEQGDEGPLVNGLLVAAVTAAVSANVSAALQAGLRPVHVDLVPFALTRAFMPLRATSAATVLISIGASTTDVVIAQGGVPLYVRMIPSGGNDVTRAIGSRLQVPYAQAEAYKRRYGLSTVASREEERPILEAIYAATWELMGSIRDTISYFTSSRRTVVLDRVILAGGGSQQPGLPSALSDIIGLPASAPDVVGTMQQSRGRGGSGESLTGMSTALGLAMGTAA